MRGLIGADFLEFADDELRIRRVLPGWNFGFGCAFGFSEQLAVVRILPQRVGADPDIALPIDHHAMALRGIPGIDDVAVEIEFDDRGRSDAAFCRGRIEHRVVLSVVDVLGAIQHPNVVLLIHVEPSDAHHPPLVGQGKLGPVRIEFVMGAVLSLFVRLILGHGARRRRCERAAKGDGCRQGIRAQLRNCWHWFHGAIPEARRHSLKFAHPSAPRS